MKLKNTLVAATLLLSITSAQAALVESDWQSTGDALATLDTETGIEWLDLTQTDSMSITEAEGFTGIGGTFEGWRLPTRAEVTQMMVNAFPSELLKFQSSGTWSITNGTTDNEADSFRALFGQTNSNSSYDYSGGLFKNDSSTGLRVIMNRVDDRRNDNYLRFYSNYSVSEDYNYFQESYGVYLVSDGGTTQSSQLDPNINANNANAPINDVSAPALTTIGGLLALFGLATIRRKTSR
jgi:hypothetical protein